MSLKITEIVWIKRRLRQLKKQVLKYEAFIKKEEKKDKDKQNIQKLNDAYHNLKIIHEEARQLIKDLREERKKSDELIEKVFGKDAHQSTSPRKKKGGTKGRKKSSSLEQQIDKTRKIQKIQNKPKLNQGRRIRNPTTDELLREASSSPGARDMQEILEREGELFVPDDIYTGSLEGEGVAAAASAQPKHSDVVNFLREMKRRFGPAVTAEHAVSARENRLNLERHQTPIVSFPQYVNKQKAADKITAWWKEYLNNVAGTKFDTNNYNKKYNGILTKYKDNEDKIKEKITKLRDDMVKTIIFEDSLRKSENSKKGLRTIQTFFTVKQ